MAPATTRPSGVNLNSFILVAGFVLNLLTILAGGIGAFYSLKGDVGVLGAKQTAASESLLIYQTNQLASAVKLSTSIDAINQLIIVRSADRYTKQDAQRDSDIMRERFASLENRLVAVENRGIERDRNLDQLNRTLGDISGALKAVRPVTR